mgnify:CR=1 FL=1
MSTQQPFNFSHAMYRLCSDVSRRLPEFHHVDMDRIAVAFAQADPVRHVVAYAFGVKRNILRMLVDRGCRVTVLPAQTPAAEALARIQGGGPGTQPAFWRAALLCAVLNVDVENVLTVASTVRKAVWPARISRARWDSGRTHSTA